MNAHRRASWRSVHAAPALAYAAHRLAV